MIWIVILAALAVIGLVALAVYAAQLRHKLGDVTHEISVVGDRVNQVTALLGQLQLPPGGRD